MRVIGSTFVVNLRYGGMPPDGVLVANPSEWCNPYRMAVSGMTRDQAVDAYILWIARRPDLLERLHELKGKKLCCWCAPSQRCHAAVLAALAEAPPPWIVQKHRMAA